MSLRGYFQEFGQNQTAKLAGGTCYDDFFLRCHDLSLWSKL
jgi:hypothetical protein